MRIDEMVEKTETTRPINEGAGSGYKVSLVGLELDIDNARFTGEKKDIDGREFWRIEMKVKSCVLDKWSTESYYFSMTSDGGEVGDDWFEYVEDDRRVDGGTTTWWVLGNDFQVYASDIYGVTTADISTQAGIRDCNGLLRRFLRDECEETVDISFDYGFGWSHSYLDNPIKIGDKTYGQPKDYYFEYPFSELMDSYANLCVFCTEASIDCKNVVDDINSFYNRSI